MCGRAFAKFGFSFFIMAAAPASNSPAGELAGYSLLMTSVRTGDTEIFLIDPDMGDAKNLTRRPKSEERYPCWSPDGARIAFISDRDGTANLYVMNADGSNVRQITRETSPTVCYMPSWTGEKIIFGVSGEKAVIGEIAPDGSGFRVVREGRDPIISPDGRTIAYTWNDGNAWCVFACDADGLNARQVTRGGSRMGAVMPAWSPDGKRITYSEQVGEALEVFACDPDGKNVRQLTRFGKISTPAAWSCDGKWISVRVTDEAYWREPKLMAKTYAEKPGDKRPVWVMRADGSDPRVIEPLRYQCAMDGSRAVWKP